VSDRPPAVQWEDECGVVHVGRPALVYARHMHSTADEQTSRSGFTGGVYCQLIKHAHTGELEWVPVGRLKPYPSEPIPEP
jgi:hypothetical protein